MKKHPKLFVNTSYKFYCLSQILDDKFGMAQHVHVWDNA